MNIPELLIELKPSKIHKGGVGVFAVVDIKNGTKVAQGLSMEDSIHLVSWETFEEFSESLKEKILDFCVGTPEGFILREGMDFNLLSVFWYISHSCEGNIGFNKDGDFIAIKDIQKGEELSYDYGLVETNPRFIIVCNCKSNNCRKFVTGNDWKLLIKDKSKKKYMHPFIIKTIKQQR